MLKNILNLLIFWGVLCAGILGTIVSEDIKESSDVVIREKRVINKENGGDLPVQIENAPYIVNIKKVNHSICVGTILSPSIVITAASCIKYSIGIYKVFSGSASIADGVRHTITMKKLHYVYRKRRSWDGIALLTVLPHFIYNEHIKHIELFEGHFFESGVHLATVSGWGFNTRSPFGTQHPHSLRTITVPTLDFEDCAIRYRGILKIDDSQICTFHTQKHCGETDIGAPLIIENRLVGIHVLGGSLKPPNKPDIYANLLHPEYHQWIRANVYNNTSN